MYFKTVRQTSDPDRLSNNHLIRYVNCINNKLHSMFIKLNSYSYFVILVSKKLVSCVHSSQYPNSPLSDLFQMLRGIIDSAGECQHLYRIPPRFRPTGSQSSN